MGIVIPEFHGAYIQRALDVEKLISTERKVYAMHTGGIVIECMLSTMVAKYFGVTERTEMKKWITTTNLSSKHVLNDSTRDYIIVPTNHFLQGWVNLTDEFLKLSDKIIPAIKTIQQPFNKDSYINLRYMDTSLVAETVFNNWKEDYDLVRKWLVEKMEIM